MSYHSNKMSISAYFVNINFSVFSYSSVLGI